MQKPAALIASLTTSVVALSGCSPREDPDTAGVVDYGNAEMMIDFASSEVAPAEYELSKITDPVEAKITALDLGRPEAAWDRYCVDWDVKNSEDGGTGLAREVAETWLAYNEAECPDAITFPSYYAQSFANGAPGEIIVTLEDAALKDYYVNPNGDVGLYHFADLIFWAVIEERPELEAVTVTVENSNRTRTTTLEEHESR